MSQFYYYIPTQQRKLSLEACNEAGLGYALEDSKTDRGCGKGPDNGQGVVVCHGDNRDGKLGHFPDQQTWKQVPGKDLWCGMYTDDKPTPWTLARRNQISGAWIIAAADGSQWLTPIARRWVELDGHIVWDLNLPQRLTLDDTGQWHPGDVLPRYRRVWDMCLDYEQVLYGQADKHIDVDDLAIAALQLNYRVSAIELDLLGVYDETFRANIIHTLIDVQTMLAWAKKNEQANSQPENDGVSSSRGPIE